MFLRFYNFLFYYMNKKERITALKELARQYPDIEHVGTIWKNPLNMRSKGIRWTKSDLILFRMFQRDYTINNID